MTQNSDMSKTKVDNGSGKQNLSPSTSESMSASSSSSESLWQLMMKQSLLETDIEEAGGEITDEQDVIWQSNELDVRDKLDSYGHLIDELAAEKKKLAFIKASGVSRVSEATQRIEKLEQKLKARLNTLSGGESLRGHLYAFHPFNSKARTVDVEKLSASETYLTIEIRQDYWEKMIEETSWINERVLPKDCFSIKKRVGKVSELPENHQAVATVLTPSVRVS